MCTYLTEQVLGGPSCARAAVADTPNTTNRKTDFIVVAVVFVGEDGLDGIRKLAMGAELRV